VGFKRKNNTRSGYWEPKSEVAATVVVVMEFLEERNNGEKEGTIIFGIFSLTFGFVTPPNPTPISLCFYHFVLGVLVLVCNFFLRKLVQKI